MTPWDQISKDISKASGRPFEYSGHHGVGGGCISAAYELVSRDGRHCFVKTNRVDACDMFDAEAQGLVEMAESHSITVPRAWCWGVAGNLAYLAMDYLPLGGSGSQAELGRQLAAMHRQGWERYGWHRDNTIGATPQDNTPDDDWTEFWRERRLGFQLQLAASMGYGGRLQGKGERLMAVFGALFDGYTPVPSLLHGDLWSGNYGFTRDGRPVIFDPATYYGDREADLAMTELFGGFGTEFYAAYNEAWPLDSGYRIRKTLYNLYHILNHLNLFGSGYAAQAERMMDQLLGELA
jgi:protein-ribulosamine 3-kinase